MNRLSGKVALITGAANGQGAAAARRFIEEGAIVAIADIADDAGKRLADELGDSATYHHLDVTSEDQWQAVVDNVVATHGRVDVLVNNAGILAFSRLVDMSLETYQKVIGVNQVGTFLGMRTVAKPMVTQRAGSIVNFSSVEGLGGGPDLVAYTASKFAVRGMTKSAAVELGKFGVRVNSIHPGAIETQMLREAAGEEGLAFVGQMVPLKRTGQPEEVADLVVFLASDESSYITGAEIAIDGGATAGSGFQ